MLQSCGQVQAVVVATIDIPTTIPAITQTVTTAPSTSQISPAATLVPTQSPLLTPTAIITPTPTLKACMRAGGRVEVDEITSDQLRDPLIYRIYLPPCYDTNTDRAYPVLYLIHGQTFSDDQWERLGAPEIADRLIAHGETSSFIIVMPRDRAWLEPTQDKFGLAVEQALVPWVDKHYRTIPDRAHRAIGGLSRGGAWAVHLGFSHPELFGAVGVHSGFVFHSDVPSFRSWLKDFGTTTTPRIYIDIANQDRPDIATSAIWMENLLTQQSIPHEWHMFIGEHEESYWQSHVEDYLRWYAKNW